MNNITNAEKPLTIEVEDDQLVMRIGINRIDGNESHPTIPSLKFDDRIQWAKEVIYEMLRDEEDGSSPVNDFIDKCINEALEQGSIGIAEDSMTHIDYCEQCEEDQVPVRHYRTYGQLCETCINELEERIK